MGESCIRGNACHGDGVYGTNDGGKTWSHLGLRDTRHIARVRVHPSDANLVYVAALGDPFAPSVARESTAQETAASPGSTFSPGASEQVRLTWP